MVVGFFPTNVVGSFSVERHHPDHPDRGHALGGLPRRWPRRSARRSGRSATAPRRSSSSSSRSSATSSGSRRTRSSRSRPHGRQQHEPRQELLVAARAAGPRLGRVRDPHLRRQRRDPRASFANVPLVAFFRKIFPAQLHRVHHAEQRRHAAGDDARSSRARSASTRRSRTSRRRSAPRSACRAAPASGRS